MIASLSVAAALLFTPLSPQEAAPATTQATPSAADAAIAAFGPLLGKVWRGASITDAGVIDEVWFERTAGGQATATPVRPPAGPIRATP